MIDVDHEQLVAFSESRKLPTRPSRSTIATWANVGCRSSSGEQVRLEAIQIGGRMFTSSQAFSRFVEALNHSSVRLK